MKQNNMHKVSIILKLTLMILYLMVAANILLKVDIPSLRESVQETEYLLQKTILSFTIFGTFLTSLYYITLQKEQADERKKAKSLFAMYIVVIMMELFSSDIANYIKDFI